jgi:hypothetical protein
MPVDTLSYSSIRENPTDRRYSIILIVLALLLGMGVLSNLFVAKIPAKPPLDATVKWVLWISAATNAFVVLLTVATLIIRARSRSDFRLIWTKAFNIFLLICIPFGTFAGIYGLWKVDKAPR